MSPAEPTSVHEQTGIYERLGVPRAINAAGTLTRLGGSIMDPRVLAAMADAARSHVALDLLQAAVGGRIAELCGAEAAIVTCGAAAGLTLAAAACIAGGDPATMDRLPHTEGLPCEIVLPRSHRNGYDHALRAAGARLVEVGLAERTRDPQPWEIAAAVTSQTVALAWFHGFSDLPLADVVTVARQQRLPVIVDASAALPPRANLRQFTDAGADLVVFSGGKGIRGPQSSGILAGRRELVASAALQMWDLDYVPELWNPPPSLIPPEWTRRGVPNHGIGRSMKVGKEEIIGLWTALEIFLVEDEAARIARLNAMSEELHAALAGIARVSVELKLTSGGWQRVQVNFPQQASQPTALDVARALEQGTPPIYPIPSWAKQHCLGFDPFGLQACDVEIIAQRVREVYATAR